jgi:hypothetical protein
MVTAGDDARTKAKWRTTLPKKQAEKETAESIKKACRKLYKRPERQRNFRYHHYA